MTAAEVAAFDRCIAAAGVALFPADTVYGLATNPESEAGVERLYRIKGRPPRRPAAVMFFSLAGALAAFPELGERTRAALELLLPGAITVVVANPRGRFPLACAGDLDRLGLRVPALSGPSAELGSVERPVLQSSANLTGEAEARRLDAVDAGVRRLVDVELDGGELPGVASSVVDLSRYERTGDYQVLREGAVAAARFERLLRSP